MSLPPPLLAATAPAAVNAELDFTAMSFALLGGLALFLLGMETLSKALRHLAGDRLRAVLARLTVNRVAGVLTGASVTALIQSSSATTVLVVGFVSAGLLSLPQSVGIIFGAEIGTTITAQILAFKITHYALPMITVGLALALIFKREIPHQGGRGLVGLGLIFYGMSLMSDAMAPLRHHAPFLEMMAQVETPIVGIALSAGFTALIQSSSATTGIVLSLAGQGLITLPAGIALLFGANIGTCITALLASIGRSREAVRAATVHILFNTLGVLIWTGVIGIDAMAALVGWVSPHSDGLSASAMLAADTPRQLANAHTLFNLLNTLAFLPFVAQFAYLARKLVPEAELAPTPQTTACVDRRLASLDESLLERPGQAIVAARNVIVDAIGQRVLRMYDEVLPALIHADPNALHIVAEMDHQIDLAYRSVVDYLGRLSVRKPLSHAHKRRIAALLEIARQLESIGDIIETNLVHLGERHIRDGDRFSVFAHEHILLSHKEVGETLNNCLTALMECDAACAHEVVQSKPHIQSLLSTATRQQTRQLAHGIGTPRTYALEMDVYEQFTRIYYHAKRIAKTLQGVGRELTQPWRSGRMGGVASSPLVAPLAAPLAPHGGSRRPRR
ncbi:Na/Pi cotransporter family protein [Magnetofaba australis]|nr:Na/Pi cotransporter family protein [Magnetofaba australis]